MWEWLWVMVRGCGADELDCSGRRIGIDGESSLMDHDMVVVPTKCHEVFGIGFAAVGPVSCDGGLGGGIGCGNPLRRIPGRVRSRSDAVEVESCGSGALG